MSENDVPRNSPGKMEQISLPQSPPEKSSSSDAGPSVCEVRDRATEQILQLILWIVVLAFSITYITYGVKYDGDCTIMSYDKTGKVSGKEDDVAVFMQIEGGFLCATVLCVLLVRLHARLQERSRTQQNTKIDLKEQKIFDRLLFISKLVLYAVNLGLCITGATKIIPLHNQKKNTISNCDPKFADFYYEAKVGQFVVVMLFAVYFIFSFILMKLLREKWFLRRKLRCWAKLLDADRDGVISQDDMRNTNEKLENLRIIFGVRQTSLEVTDQRKWWDDNIFKQGAVEEIKVDDYVHSVENYLGNGAAYDRANRIRPVVTTWFDFFTTEEYINRNLDMTDFVRFWNELSGDDEQHYRRMLIKHFPSPLTMSDFLEDFVAFLSNPEYLNEFSSRVFQVVKYRSGGVCLKS